MIIVFKTHRVRGLVLPGYFSFKYDLSAMFKIRKKNFVFLLPLFVLAKYVLFAVVYRYFFQNIIINRPNNQPPTMSNIGCDALQNVCRALTVNL
ncbi:hypothetical protein GY26_15770 [Gammaproteobacteria bacterium MFB021]|nr:hypothetical protein GY26_15770 [Gammaproteobacteria bacterium MFB021]